MHLDTWLAITGIAIGVVALMMAAPPLFQMIWGKPKVSAKFEVSNLEPSGGKQLRCYISNTPVQNRFLNAMGVVRQPIEIFAIYSIYEFGSNKCIVHNGRALIGTDRENGGGLQVTLFASTMPARFSLVAHQDGMEAITISHRHPEPGIAIAAGRYTASVTIHAGDHSMHQIERGFTVGDRPSRTYWLR
jgi:hypothetical protein